MGQTNNAPVVLTLEAALARIEQLEQDALNAEVAYSELKDLFDEQGQTLAATELEKAELAAQVTKLKATPQPFPTVDVAGVPYAITVPSFQYRKQEYTASELATMPALAAELVEKGMGFLQPLTAAE